MLIELVACEGCGWECEPVELEPGPSGDPHCSDCLQTIAQNRPYAY
jgi:hypothetical protein